MADAARARPSLRATAWRAWRFPREHVRCCGQRRGGCGRCRESTSVAAGNGVAGVAGAARARPLLRAREWRAWQMPREHVRCCGQGSGGPVSGHWSLGPTASGGPTPRTRCFQHGDPADTLDGAVATSSPARAGEQVPECRRSRPAAPVRIRPQRPATRDRPATPPLAATRLPASPPRPATPPLAATRLPASPPRPASPLKTSPAPPPTAGTPGPAPSAPLPAPALHPDRRSPRPPAPRSARG